MATISEWYDFAERLRSTAIRMLEVLEKPIEPEPKVYAITLLARTISNFNSAMILHSAHQIMEARVLVRCCWENAFYLAGMAKHGPLFLKAMKDDDAASRRARGDLLFEIKVVDGDTEGDRPPISGPVGMLV
jgi:HEAT repeat protein